MWWGGLRVAVSLRALLAGPFEVLVGSPMPDRSRPGPDKEQSSGPPGFGVLHRTKTLSCKTLFVTETATCNLRESSVQNEPRESMPWAAVNTENENIRISAGNGIRTTDSGQSRKKPLL